MAESEPRNENQRSGTPVRGSLRLTVNASSPQVGAGSNFSIFVLIQNPFDVPITVHQVQTHIPVELVDVNGLRLELAKRDTETKSLGVLGKLQESLKRRIGSTVIHSGVAIAVGTEFDPMENEFINASVNVGGSVGEGASIAGVQFSFPERPTTEQLDQIFTRLSGYKKGLIPIQLQPGDSVVKQFVLRTRHWLFFTPLTHRFQIQVNYTGDGVDHTDTIAYEQSIRSSFGAVIIGSVSGAVLGTLLKPSEDLLHPLSPTGLSFRL